MNSIIALLHFICFDIHVLQFIQILITIPVVLIIAPYVSRIDKSYAFGNLQLVLIFFLYCGVVDKLVWDPLKNNKNDVFFFFFSETNATRYYSLILYMEIEVFKRTYVLLHFNLNSSKIVKYYYCLCLEVFIRQIYATGKQQTATET